MVLFMSVMSLFFFFKQKTAYEMRISDWSSDVCSSDLATSFIGKITCHYDYHSYYRVQEESRSCPIPQPSSSEPATPPAARSPAPLPPRASSPASTAGHATPSSSKPSRSRSATRGIRRTPSPPTRATKRSEEHTSELQSLMRISYAVFCLK